MTTEKVKREKESKRSPVRQKSIGYPSMDLGTAVEIIKKAVAYGPMDRTVVAQLMGHQVVSGPALRKLAALKHFNLMEYEKGKASLTELAKRIASPLPEEDPKQALMEAFFMVSPFKELFEQCKKDTALEREALRNIAVRQLEITAKAAPEFIEIFVLSGKAAGLIEAVDEKSVRFLSQPSLPKEMGAAEVPPVREEAPPQAGERAKGFIQNWNVNLTVDSSMEPEKLRELIQVLKSELA